LLVTVTLLVVRDGDPADELVAEGATDASTSSTTEPTTTSAHPLTTVTTLPPSTAPATTASPRITAAPRAPATTTTRPPAPPFQGSVQHVTQEELGASWGADPGCAQPAELRKVTVSHWGYDGQVKTGQLIVHDAYAGRIVTVFRDIYAARFPIERMVPIAAYGGDDQASMRANNTSGYNCRTVAGSSTLSQHAYGAAIDVNPLQNPYVRNGTVDPPEGAPWADRSRTDPGMIKAGDAVVAAFARQGWGWGGYWSSGKDYQHFSASGG
jgi:hypothetical protein